MKNQEIKNYTFITGLLLVPLLLAFFSFNFFEKASQEKTDQIALISGKIAGVTDKRVTDLTKSLPIMPNAEIVSLDTSSGKVSATLESSQTEEEITTYYNDYLFTNGWKELGEHTYKKDPYILKLEIMEGVITLKLEKIPF